MAAQTVPAQPPFAATFTGPSVEVNQDRRTLLQLLQIDLINLRNSFDALVTSYNAHNHKAYGAAAQTSAPDSAAAGGAATTPIVLAAPATVVASGT